MQKRGTVVTGAPQGLNHSERLASTATNQHGFLPVAEAGIPWTT